MIQFITHTNDRYDYVEGARLALAGGCRWIQLRMKDAPKDTFLAAATAIGQLCKTYHATFILDDHAEWVQEAGADGVHLGKNDMPVNEARKLLGSRYVIGGTANTFDDVERLYRDGADYIGCGPFRFTTTKQKLSPILGADGYRRIVSQMKLHYITIPIVAIGGILSSDIPDVMATGVSGIAVSGAILNADSPVEEMQRFIRLTEKKNSQITQYKRNGNKNQDQLSIFRESLSARKTLSGTARGYEKGKPHPHRHFQGRCAP